MKRRKNSWPTTAHIKGGHLECCSMSLLITYFFPTPFMQTFHRTHFSLKLTRGCKSVVIFNGKSNTEPRSSHGVIIHAQVLLKTFYMYVKISLRVVWGVQILSSELCELGPSPSSLVKFLCKLQQDALLLHFPKNYHLWRSDAVTF